MEGDAEGLELSVQRPSRKPQECKYFFEDLEIPCMVFAGIMAREVCGGDVGDGFCLNTNNLFVPC